MPIDCPPPTQEEARWIKKLEQLLEQMPKDLWLFVNGDVHVMRKGPDGQRVMKALSVDSEWSLKSIPADCDGGGF